VNADIETRFCILMDNRGRTTMDKPTYEKPVVEVLTADELLEAIGVGNCASGGGFPS
jgi:hypothetical protein